MRGLYISAGWRRATPTKCRLAFNRLDQIINDIAGFNQRFFTATTVFILNIVVIQVALIKGLAGCEAFTYLPGGAGQPQQNVV
ncbi:hypothetical protein D6F94_12615 [Salmonella enterica]|nr:hypothetical protein [Salmonella enterica]EAU1979313.1 hypothetical protein [Salmonella enterica]